MYVSGNLFALEQDMTFSNLIVWLFAVVIVAVAAHEVRSEVRHAEMLSLKRAESPTESRLVRLGREQLADQLHCSEKIGSVLGFVPRGESLHRLERLADGQADHATLLARDGDHLVHVVVVVD